MLHFFSQWSVLAPFHAQQRCIGEEADVLDVVQVAELRAACFQELLQNVSLDTFFEYLITADSCCGSNLLVTCMAFAALNRYLHIKL